MAVEAMEEAVDAAATSRAAPEESLALVSLAGERRAKEELGAAAGNKSASCRVARVPHERGRA